MTEEKISNNETVLDDFEELDFPEIRSDLISDSNESYLWTLYPKIIIKNGVKSRSYSLYLYNAIGEQSYYSRIFETIRRLTENDTLDIYINSPGGCLTTLVSFLNVLERSKAHIITHIDGFAESAAAILLFAGDEIDILPMAEVMFHNIQSANGILQDTGHIRANIEALHKMYKEVLQKYCSKVLSKKEISDIIMHGLEIYLTGNDIKARLSI